MISGQRKTAHVMEAIKTLGVKQEGLLKLTALCVFLLVWSVYPQKLEKWNGLERASHTTLYLWICKMNSSSNFGLPCSASTTLVSGMSVTSVTFCGEDWMIEVSSSTAVVSDTLFSSGHVSTITLSTPSGRSRGKV